MKNSVHIGEEVRMRVHALRMSVIDFAEKINKSRTVVYHIFKRKSIDSELLKKISETLQFDFFSYYTQYLPEDFESKVSEPESATYYELQKTNYEAKIEALMKEISYLKEINEMLRERLKEKAEPN